MSGVLADTATLLWWLSNDPRLTSKALELIGDGEEDIHFSAASAWEIAIKQALGKLELTGAPVEAFVARGFIEVAITARHGIAAGALPPHHRDPFDRVLVAQAQLEGLRLLTPDEKLARYDVVIVW